MRTTGREDAAGRPAGGLLGAGDGAPVLLLNAEGASPFLLTGDHAGNSIPKRLGTLGLPDSERNRHIGWDIGVMALGAALAARLDAAFVAQRYSRLVIDCNRDPASPEAVPVVADGTVVPGNAALTSADIAARFADIHAPYQAALAATIAARIARSQPTILIALHSFTPALAGKARPWEIGILYAQGDTRFAQALLKVLEAIPGLTVGDNEPYRMDATDHSIPRHAFGGALPYAEIEVRQDQLADAEGQARWCDLLGDVLERAGRVSGAMR